MRAIPRAPRREAGERLPQRTETVDARISSWPYLSLARSAHMSRPASLASRIVQAGYLRVCRCKCSPADNLPTGTYVTEMSESHQEFCIEALHAIGLFCEDVDHQLLVLRFPPSSLSMRVNDRLDVVFDVSLLSALVMQGNRAES